MTDAGLRAFVLLALAVIILLLVLIAAQLDSIGGDLEPTTTELPEQAHD